MPGRKAKPPRLWLRPDEGTYVILHRGRQIRTGCGADEAEAAGKALAKYIGAQHRPAVGQRDPDELPIADTITAYEEAKRPKFFERPREKLTPEQWQDVQHHIELCGRLGNINEFFGDKTVSAIKAQLCRDYVDWCTGTKNERNRGIHRRQRNGKPATVKPGTARRELEDLRAAINMYHRDHVLTALPTVTMPARGEGRERWLSRNEAARALGAALGFVWDADKGTWRRNASGGLYRRDRATIVRRRHIARFILISLYNNRREATVRRTRWVASTTTPYFDLDALIYHGRGSAERKTKKRRPPTRISNRLRPHLVRWRRLDRELSERVGFPVIHPIHQTTGHPLADKIKTGWIGILEDAGLGREVVRHVLRHTAATWLMQNGTQLWSAAGFMAMTVKQLEEGYGHHHPDFQREAAESFDSRKRNAG